MSIIRMDTTIQQEHTVNLFLYIFSNFENKLLPKKTIIIRNNKEAQEVFGEGHGGGEYKLERPSQAEAHNI